MTDRPTPQRSRLARDLFAVLLGLIGTTSMIWAAVLIDWRLAMGLVGLLLVLFAAFLAQGVEE